MWFVYTLVAAAAAASLMWRVVQSLTCTSAREHEVNERCQKARKRIQKEK